MPLDSPRKFATYLEKKDFLLVWNKVHDRIVSFTTKKNYTSQKCEVFFKYSQKPKSFTNFR